MSGRQRLRHPSASGSLPVPGGNPAVSRCVARSATTRERDCPPRPPHPCPLSPPAGVRRFFANDRGCGCAARPGYRLRSFQERGKLRTRMERAKQSVAGFCRWPSGSRRGTQPLAGAWHMAPPPESEMKKAADPGRDRSGALKRQARATRGVFSRVPPAGLVGLNSRPRQSCPLSPPAGVRRFFCE